MTVVNIYSSGMWRLAALCLMYGVSECVRVSQWRARKYNVCENVLRFGQIILSLHTKNVRGDDILYVSDVRFYESEI